MNQRDDTSPIDGDDVEGHRFYSGSDRNIKDEVEPLRWEGDDDTEGHAATGKAADEEAVEGEGEGDVEGHRFSSSDRHIKNEVEPLRWEGDTRPGADA